MLFKRAPRPEVNILAPPRREGICLPSLCDKREDGSCEPIKGAPPRFGITFSCDIEVAGQQDVQRMQSGTRRKGCKSHGDLTLNDRTLYECFMTESDVLNHKDFISSPSVQQLVGAKICNSQLNVGAQFLNILCR
jgi:hypothetical protein